MERKFEGEQGSVAKEKPQLKNNLGQVKPAISRLVFTGLILSLLSAGACKKTEETPEITPKYKLSNDVIFASPEMKPGTILSKIIDVKSNEPTSLGKEASLTLRNENEVEIPSGFIELITNTIPETDSTEERAEDLIIILNKLDKQKMGLDTTRELQLITGELDYGAEGGQNLNVEIFITK